MASNVAVFLFSLTTLLFSIASFRATEDQSYEGAVLSLVIGGLAWAVGSVLGYLLPILRQASTTAGMSLRWATTLLFALLVGVWPWVGPGELGQVIFALALFCSGVLIPSIISLKHEDVGEMRESYAKSLIGSALGAALSSALVHWRGPGALFALAAAAVFLAPFAEPVLYFAAEKKSRRWATLPAVALALGLSFIAPSQWGPPTAATGAATPFGAEAIYKFREGRKLDVYVVGGGAAQFAATVRPEIFEKSIRSLSVTEQNPELAAPAPTGVEITLNAGSGRRRLAAETRRFDLIQVVAPNDSFEATERRFGSRSEGALTVEAMRLYFDRLKDDGYLQIVGRTTGATAQATLSTISEAWKKSARKDVDLHAIAVASDGGKTIETVIVRMKPFLREERDGLGGILKVGKGESGPSWILVSDGSGAVLTDDRPFVGAVVPPSGGSRAVLWICVAAVLGLIVWVAMQERRKGLVSRWQTASVATYFGGLGISFAFFQVFFVLRAIRGWGIPSIAMGLVLAAVFVALAAGATLLAGHPRRRYGVRIQPLANFVFAVMFTYLGAAWFEPLVANGSEWISAMVGMSVVIPFGLLGGAFFPNALEEASEKLAPRVLSLLWALYAAGTALGIYAATAIGIENGLDVVFLSGLFCFAWVAIFSGLVRPWNVRKAGTAP